MRRLQYLLFFALFAVPLLAQQPAAPPPPAPLFNATTRNVILDAVVSDKKGNVVTGLTRSDFVIREDNTPQEIRSFDAVAAGTSSEDAAPRTILLVDEMNTRFEDMAFTRYSVDRLLRHDGVKLNQPTALYILSNDGLHVLQDYTRDPAALNAALRAHAAVLPWRLRGNFYRGVERIQMSTMALQQIAIANMGAPGHKNIVWISPGFPIFSALEIGAEGQKLLFDSIRHLSDQLLKARISIYSVDPRGVNGQFLANGGISNNIAFSAYLNALSSADNVGFGNLAIQTLATQTGGHAFFGRNDVDQEIASSLTDGNTYYTLSYAPSNHDFHGEFRKVRISVINRPDLKVQTRDGYYAIPDGQPPDPKQQMQELVSSLLAPIPFSGISIPISFTHFTKSPPSIKVRLLVSSTSLTWAPDAAGHLRTHVAVAVAYRSKHGEWKAALANLYSASLPDGTVPSQHLTTTLTFEMPFRSSNQLRFVVRDDTSGRVGSSEIKLDPSVTGVS